MLEKQSQNLSEGETLDKIKNFFKKVWIGVVQIAKKIWARIKDVMRLAVRKLSEWASKIGHL